MSWLEGFGWRAREDIEFSFVGTDDHPAALTGERGEATEAKNERLKVRDAECEG